jgi:hypothetical protein
MQELVRSDHPDVPDETAEPQHGERQDQAKDHPNPGTTPSASWQRLA